MSPRPPGMWSAAELRRDADQARQLFVQDRIAALVSEQRTYETAQKEAVDAVERLLDATKDLRAINGTALQDRAVLNIARYLAVPPISLDDLDTLTDSAFRNWVGQKTDKGIRPSNAEFRAAATIIASRIDRNRAPWVSANRKPTRQERNVFVQWSAGIPASGAVLTARRGEASARQEAAIRAAAKAAGYDEVTPPGTLTDPIKQMPPKTYASASRKLNATNMDVPIRLRDPHPTGLLFLAIEAKVSNSSLNSRKRLIEVTRKRDVWDNAGTLYSFRTAAVLAGVFDVERLVEAQQAGVLLFWQHRLTDLTRFL